VTNHNLYVVVVATLVMCTVADMDAVAREAKLVPPNPQP